MSRQDLIQAFLKEPVKVGDSVTVRGLGVQNKEQMGNTTKVKQLGENDSVFIEEYGSLREIAKEDYIRNTNHVGYNPFVEKPWNTRMRIIAFDLSSIISQIFDIEKKEFRVEKDYYGYDIPELNWNPTIVDGDGNDVHYQRDFCWSLQDKQLLIDSIYNSLDIGKIIVRKRGYNWPVERAKQGKETAFKDIVDGKQRLNAIISFVKGDFCDSEGFYWEDLSSNAKRHFFGFSAVSYGEIEEGATDEDVKAIFLGVNFTGVQMSQEHIDFVKNIRL